MCVYVRGIGRDVYHVVAPSFLENARTIKHKWRMSKVEWVRSHCVGW